MPSLDLANAANWRSIWTVNATATPGVRPWLQTPIPDQQVGVLVNSPLLAIYPNFTPDPNTRQPRWKFAGFAVQQFQLGLTGNPAPSSQGEIWRKLWINQIQFVAFESWQIPYGLTLKVPYWFPQWRCNIWEFTGAIPDQWNKLNSIQSNVQSNLAVLRSQIGGVEVQLDQVLADLTQIQNKLDNP